MSPDARFDQRSPLESMLRAGSPRRRKDAPGPAHLLLQDELVVRYRTVRVPQRRRSPRTAAERRAASAAEFARKSYRGRTLGNLQRAQAAFQQGEADRVLALVDGFRAVCEQGERRNEAVDRSHPMVDAFLLHASRLLCVHRNTAAHLLDAALELETRLPLVWAKFVAGGCSWASADAALAESAGLDTTHLGAFDARAVALVGERPAGEIRRTLLRVRERLQADTAGERTRAATTVRRVGLDPLRDGQAELPLVGPIAPLKAINDGLTQVAIGLKAKEGEDRTVAQLRFDTAVDILLSGLTAGSAPAGAQPGTSRAGDESSGSAPTAEPTDTAGGAAFGLQPVGLQPVGDRPGIVAQVYLTIPALTLLGVGDEPARLHGYGPIDLDTAKLLAGTATAWTRILTDPITGDPLRIDSRARRVPKVIRKWLQVARETCQGLGCTRPAWLADHDHRHDHALGGRTRLDNTDVLCRPDHGRKGSPYFDTEGTSDGGLDWHSAWGATFSVPPPDHPEPAPLDALRDLYPDDPPF